MPTFQRRSQIKSKHVFLCAVLLLVATAVGATATRMRVDRARDMTVAAVETFGDTAQSKPGTRLKTVAVTLTPDGFQPQTIEQKKGPFFFAVNNRTGIDGLTIELKREVGGGLKEIKMDTKHHRGAEVFDLPPGRYLVTTDNPSWICRLTIAAP